jgi:23S rRNA (adenine2030-N6)-methyltransferase
MNYRHAFHAGNFADVVKHAVLTRILLHLQEKPAAFRVIDTHAGAGLYDLSGEEARRSGEWRDGIGRLLSDAEGGEAGRTAAAELLRPYLDIVRSYNQGEDQLAAYPGSPLIARAQLRPQDRMTACELEPGASRQLIGHLRRDAQARVVAIDGWTALTAYVPPNERRGLVLVDPPFEQANEFERMASAFDAAFAKWPTGIFALWYPVKDVRAAGRFAQAVARSIARQHAVPAKGRASANLSEKCLRVVFQTVPEMRSAAGLVSAGLMIANPPWTLEQELRAIMPLLARRLGREGDGRFTIDRPLA